MTQQPRHTPYDGTSRPFTIGLKPLELGDWIEIDRHYDVFLAEKDRLIAARPGDVFAAEAATGDPQAEVLELVLAHLIGLLREDPPDLSERTSIERRLAEFSGRPVGIQGEPALQRAARLVQEDLVLMRRSAEGWRLVAASLCFPSSWSLAEKFGRPLHEVHAPVPGFGTGTRNATVIERIFDNLATDRPVRRANWSLQADPERHKPLPHAGREDRAERHLPRLGSEPLETGFLRVETQTLRRLPRSGDILFTIRIHLDPLALLVAHPERPFLCRALAQQLARLDARQLDYKGLAADRDRLVDALQAMSDAASPEQDGP